MRAMRRAATVIDASRRRRAAIATAARGRRRRAIAAIAPLLAVSVLAASCSAETPDFEFDVGGAGHGAVVARL